MSRPIGILWEGDSCGGVREYYSIESHLGIASTCGWRLSSQLIYTIGGVRLELLHRTKISQCRLARTEFSSTVGNKRKPRNPIVSYS